MPSLCNAPLYRSRLWIVALLVALGCAPAREPRPNVLLISLDTTRADHCSLYGYPGGTTPNLGFLAQSGARFDVAYSPTATTGPSHATIFTGLYSLTHRVVKNGLPLAEDFSTLAERLAAAGYQTAAFPGSYVLADKFGYGQGFARFDDNFELAESAGRVTSWEGKPIDGAFDRRAAFGTRRALDWLQARTTDDPFFLFVHYFDPHDPYLPPAEYLQHSGLLEREFDSDLERAIALYDAEIAYMDNELGRLFQALSSRGVLDETIVVVVGDHGEGLMDHDYMYHGVHLYEEAVRVPLVIRWPEQIAAQVVTTPVELVDLLPSVLDLAGVDFDLAELHGRNLGPSLRGDLPFDPARPVFLHRRDYREELEGPNPPRGQKYAVRAGRWKFILGPEENTRELFDLGEDPRERNNLEGTQAEVTEALEDMLRQWRERFEQDLSVGAVADEDREKLRALGYTN